MYVIMGLQLFACDDCSSSSLHKNEQIMGLLNIGQIHLRVYVLMKMWENALLGDARFDMIFNL